MNIWVKEGHEGAIGNELRLMDRVKVDQIFPADKDGYVRIHIYTTILDWALDDILKERFPSIPFTINH